MFVKSLPSHAFTCIQQKFCSHLTVIEQPVKEMSLNNYEILIQNIPKHAGSITKAVLQLLCLTGIST